MRPFANSKVMDDKIAALSSYVSDGESVSVLLPKSQSAVLGPWLGQLGSVVTYGKGAMGGIAADRTVFAVPPEMPAAHDLTGLMEFTCQSEQFATICASLTRWVALDARSLVDADADVLRPLRPRAGLMAGCFLEWVTSRPQMFCTPGGRYPLPQTGWEIELGDLSRERMCQAPAGEVFAHFDAGGWTGEIDLAHGGTLVLSAGRVVQGPDWTLYKRVCEVGFGLNPAVRDTHCPWGEKALGTVHLGIGIADDADLAPPSMHSDIMIDPAKSLNHDLWRCF